MFDDMDDDDLTYLLAEKDISEEENRRREREQRTRRMTVSEVSFSDFPFVTLSYTQHYYATN